MVVFCCEMSIQVYLFVHVCTAASVSLQCQPTDLIAHVEGKEQHQHAGGRVASVVSGPVVVDVLEECWVEDLDLVGDHGTK